MTIAQPHAGAASLYRLSVGRNRGPHPRAGSGSRRRLLKRHFVEAAQLAAVQLRQPVFTQVLECADADLQVL